MARTELKWKENSDPNSIEVFTSDIGPAHLVIYEDFDWYAMVHFAGGLGYVNFAPKNCANCLESAKSECEAAARKLLALREHWEVIK